jgi:RNA polymerase sigma-70 factor (ECF subfamily)
LSAHAWVETADATCEQLFFAYLGSRVDLQERIQAFRDAGDLRAAATTAVEGYGPEVFGFLVAVLRNETDASDAFAQTCEDMWRGFEGFKGRCTVRTWLYTLARHAAVRLRRSPHGKKQRRVPLSEVSDIAERVRSDTQRHLRTSAKDKLSFIRASLDEDDQSLLILRVDRNMSWADIALIESPFDASDDDLARTAARLRKRYELLKKRVKALASKVGLVSDREEI